MIQDYGFLEFPYLGDWLSWRGWRDKKSIRCRLDSALGNEDWHYLFNNSFIEYLQMVASDHAPVITTIADKSHAVSESFGLIKDGSAKRGY